MDFDLFFSAPRWKILAIIAKRPSSPIEIATQLRTSVSYVSQQLKLLEAANLVTKEKTGSFEKGKPRTIFSIEKEIAYLTVLTKDFPVKKALPLTEHNKSILRIWLIENSELHQVLEKLYWKIEEEISEINAILLSQAQQKNKVIVISESKKVKQKLEAFFKDLPGMLDYSCITKNELHKLPSGKIHVIYNPENLIVQITDAKGDILKDVKNVKN